MNYCHIKKTIMKSMFFAIFISALSFAQDSSKNLEKVNQEITRVCDLILKSELSDFNDKKKLEKTKQELQTQNSEEKETLLNFLKKKKKKTCTLKPLKKNFKSLKKQLYLKNL